jgi:hypothetical protein
VKYVSPEIGINSDGFSKLIMKLFYITLMMFAAVLTTEKLEMVEQILSEEQEKTEAEIISELKCINESSYLPLFNAQWPSGTQYLRDQLATGATNNRKFYVQLDANHKVAYFREGENYFVNVILQAQDDGEEEVVERMFVPTTLKDCIRILPASCKWKGQREVKYVEICESGLDLANGIKRDLFKVAIDSDSGTITPQDIVIAIRDCYQPNVYSIPYECFQKGLFFDHQKALDYLNMALGYFKAKGYDARILNEQMAIQYSKTAFDVTFNGENVDMP